MGLPVSVIPVVLAVPVVLLVPPICPDSRPVVDVQLDSELLEPLVVADPQEEEAVDHLVEMVRCREVAEVHRIRPGRSLCQTDRQDQGYDIL